MRWAAVDDERSADPQIETPLVRRPTSAATPERLRLTSSAARNVLLTSVQGRRFGSSVLGESGFAAAQPPLVGRVELTSGYLTYGSTDDHGQGVSLG